MNQVILNMTDDMTGEAESIMISHTNAMSPMGKMGGKADQRANLESWISAHGNDQFGTYLSLNDWRFA